MKQIVFTKTKAGKGFKILVDEVWLYVSQTNLQAVLEGKITSCKFSTIESN